MITDIVYAGLINIGYRMKTYGGARTCYTASPNPSHYTNMLFDPCMPCGVCKTLPHLIGLTEEDARAYEGRKPKI